MSSKASKSAAEKLGTRLTGYEYIALQVRERRADRHGIVMDHQSFSPNSQEMFVAAVGDVGGKVWKRTSKQIVYFGKVKRVYLTRAYVPDPDNEGLDWSPVPEDRVRP